ncbi:MAG: sugar phosphate nucleotidyltransferase [Bacteroidia bacterium]|nr:sugar phosphate nucleotidyltransferase [Bacteroidia bacterium]
MTLFRMQKPALLILAAGVGSRYGSLKQLDRLGPSGETIMDYSVYDAIRAGFGKIVFVIRRDIEQEFNETFISKFEGRIQIRYVLQELDNIPAGLTYNPERVKPWGTGHAVMVAADAIDEPFAMLNADDFYGREAFEAMGQYLSGLQADAHTWAMVGYKVKNTLSEFGFVSRGVCETDANDNLQSVVERTHIGREDGQIVYQDQDQRMPLDEDALVSMNFWGFTPTVFDFCRTYFEEFIREKGHELKSELYIPTVVNRAIHEHGASLRVLTSDANWFGVTYKEDKAMAVQRLAELVAAGHYPANLWA